MRRCLTKSSPKVAEGGAELATVMVKPPTCDPAPEQRLEVQRLVLLRLHAVVSGSHQNRAKPPAALSRSAEQLRINAQSAVMRNCSALWLRLAPDGGFAQLFLTACISQQALASGEQYVWPEVSRRTGSSSRFGDLMGE